MKEKLKEPFNLKSDQASNEEIRNRIDSGAAVSGSNMYILIFAILIASIGLNMNSTAVVIGAMLISPLMGVLMSMAYAISNQDTSLLKNSIYKFIFQVSISILTSTIYFLLSPMETFSGELVARTHPTLWDALIAFFGGFAAVIANTRESKVSNVIPGAAIATALMPPLCTVGYCLSSAKWLSALGAFYLFLINVIFICLSSVIGFRIMKVSNGKDIVKTRKDRIAIALIIAVAIIPSSILAAQTVQESYTEMQYREFIQKELDFDDTQVVKSNIDSKKKTIEVVLIGDVLEEDKVEKIEKSLDKYSLSDYEINIIQTHINNGFSKEDIKEIIDFESSQSNASELEKDLINTKKLLEIQTNANDLQINTAKEVMILYPKVKSAGFMDLYDQDGIKHFSFVLMVEENLSNKETTSLNDWVNSKFESKVEIVQIKDTEK